MPMMPPIRTRTSDEEVGSECMYCAFCLVDIQPLSVPERETHYESHMNHDSASQVEGMEGAPIVIDTLSQSSRQDEKSTNISSLPKKKLGKTLPCLKETDDFWYSAQATPPPPSFTPGLIQLLRNGLLKSHARGQTRRAVLCHENAVHVKREPWDAKWGCGYRNFLMACTGLMNQTHQPLYFPLLDSPLSPGIRNLQTWIESAWKHGFDKEGKQDLKKLVDTKKWIGTADLWVAFAFRGIPAELVDFDLGKQSQEKAADLVVNWVANYFTPSQSSSKPTDAFESLKISPITVTDKMPLILQHDGHSRTVVGYEVDKNGVTNLLMFDPSYSLPAELRKAALEEFTAHGRTLVDQSPSLKRKRSVRHESQNEQSSKSGEIGNGLFKSPFKPFSSIGNGKHGKEGKEIMDYSAIKKFRLEPTKLRHKKQYQILYFPMTAPLTDKERMQCKVVRSTKIS